MKSAFKYTLILIAISFLVNCEKYEVTSRDYPRVSTLAVDNITEEGATFNAEFKLRGEFEVVNYGFVWSTLENPTIDDSDRVVYAENIQSNTFSQRIETTLKKENIYNVRAFVKTKNYLIYGENVEFYSRGSNGPELLDFSPKIGNIGDTIKLKATSFGRLANNVKVKINQTYVDVETFDEKEISIVIPNTLEVEKSEISVELAFNRSAYNEKFTLNKPLINNVYPIDITFGTEVTIEGSYLDSNKENVSVLFKGTNDLVFTAQIISIKENFIKVKVPSGINTKQNNIFVSMNNFEVTYDQTLSIIDPLINSISPQSGKTLSELTIEGENFSPIADNNIVLIDNYLAEIVRSENNKIVVTVPSQSNHIYSNRNVTVSVEVLSTQTQATNQFKVTDKWFRLSDIPFRNPYESFEAWKGVTVNGKGHVLYKGGHWKFNPEDNQWTELKMFPDTDRSEPGIFSVEDKIYLVGGTRPNYFIESTAVDLWEYDIVTNSWTQKADFPGKPRYMPFVFSIGSNGYVGAGLLNQPTTYFEEYNDDWKYDTKTDTWSKISNFPLSTLNETGSWNFSTIESGNEVYIGLGKNTTNKIYKFSESSGEWTQFENYPSPYNVDHNGGVAFTVDNKLFFGSGYYLDELWGYDGNKWTSYGMNTFVGKVNGFNFVIDNIAYFGCGNHFANLTQFWSFDISQPD